MFENKKIFIIGDKDGVSAPAIGKCLSNFKGEIIFATTECFSCSFAGVMNDELQNKLLENAEKYGAEAIVVVIGGSEVEASVITAKTITAGDETGFGPLAGISLGIPVYHILEKEIKKQCDEEVFEEQCGILELVLPVDEIITELISSRNKYSKF